MVEAAAVTPTRATAWRAAQRALPALLYLAIRFVGIGVLALFQPGNLTNALTKWDGQWYLGIAAHGYANAPNYLTDADGTRTSDTPLAFFPGYPFLVHLVDYLPGVGLASAGVLVSLAAGIPIAYGLVRIGELVPRHGSRTVGLLLVALFSAAPMGIVLGMAYAEAVFCAFAVWSLVFVLRKQWILAGALAALAGLVRPSAVALVAAVSLAALVAVLRNPRDWRAWLGGLLGPLGVLGYALWVGARTGSLTGYFSLQRTSWGTYFDGGASVFRFAVRTLSTGSHPFEVVTVGIVLAALAVFAVAVHQRLPWPLLVYSAGVLIMALGMNGLMGAKARLLLPAFVLLLPVAIGLAKRTTTTVLATLTAVTLASGWFGAYALSVWPYAM